ncbi:DUF3857 domain-containing protein [candidate division GN15 bacterium]|nr:DUF3857 domain-containing protein [candidate division GN15 bacterium]
MVATLDRFVGPDLYYPYHTQFLMGASAMKSFVLAVGLGVVFCSTAAADQAAPAAASDFARIDTDSLITNPPEISRYAEYGSICLFDLDSMWVNADYTYTRCSHIARLITSADGAHDFGTRWITYRTGYDSIVIDIARTILPDGSRLEVPPDQIDLDIIPSATMKNDLYTDRRQARINFERLEPGAIVEFKYRLISYYRDFPGFSASSWLNSGTPTQVAQVVLEYASESPVFSKTSNFAQSPIEERFDGRVRKSWQRDDLPTLVRENNMRPYRDRCHLIMHSSFPDWRSFATSMYEILWRDELSRPISESELAYLAGLSFEGSSRRDTIRTVFDALQRDIRYLGLELGVHNLKPHASSVICEKRYGDCKDQAMLLVRLFRHLGYVTQPVLVATVGTTTRFDTTFADYGRLNHAVVRVMADDETFWLDPTLLAGPLDWVPVYIQGSIGVVLGDPIEIVRVPINPPAIELTRMESELMLDTLGVARGQSRMALGGTLGVLEMKPALRQMPQADIARAMEATFAPAVVEAYSLAGVTTNDSILTIDLEVTSHDYADRAGEMLIISRSEPVSSAFDKTGRGADRSTDLFFGRAFINVNKARVTIPDAYTVQHLPEPVDFHSPYFDFTTHWQVIDSITIAKTDSLTFKALAIDVEQYDTYRQLADSLDQLGRRSLALAPRE